MAIKFQPKKEEELGSNFDCLPPGTYPFTVLESGEIASKSEKNKGKLMCAVKLNVHGPKFDRHVYDYFAPEWLSPWKVKHFCETTGQSAAYEAGVVDSDNQAWQGKTGWVKVKIDPANGNYPEKNVVEDYIVKVVGAAPAATPPADDTDVPF